MRIGVVTPAGPATQHGNGVTAHRWAGILSSLGHDVEVTGSYDGQPLDVLVALHARKSADAVRTATRDRPRARVVVALTGTDLYPDLITAGVDLAVLAAADRLVVLQHRALEQLPPELRARTRVIHQSVDPQPPAPVAAGVFDVVELAHLRAVKDPLLVAAAVALLPGDSRIRVLHAGAVLDPDLGERAAHHDRETARYHWLGALPRTEALALLASSRLMVHPSRHEGGANVTSEAIATGIPVLASRIPGTVGLLGEAYPGYFPAGDAAALAELLVRCERNTDGCYDELLRRIRALRPLTDPQTEQRAWQQLLAELAVHP